MNSPKRFSKYHKIKKLKRVLNPIVAQSAKTLLLSNYASYKTSLQRNPAFGADLKYEIATITYQQSFIDVVVLCKKIF